METENTFKVVTREDKLKGLLLLAPRPSRAKRYCAPSSA